MKVGWLLVALPSVALADIYKEGPPGPEVEAFAAQTPKARQTLDQLDVYVFLGNKVCDHDGPASGGFTSWGVSTDNSLFFAVTTVRSDAKVVRALRVVNKDDANGKEMTVFIAVSASGALWSVLAPYAGECERLNTTIVFGAKNKRALALSSRFAAAGPVPQLELVDTSKHEVLLSTSFELAGNLTQLTYVNDKRFTVCADAAQLQLDWNDDKLEIVTKKLGACLPPAPKVVAPAAPPAAPAPKKP